MSKSKKKKQPSGNTIALNRKAKHDFHLSEKMEAGVALSGWEVKALRAGRGQLTESYVVFEKGEAWLLHAMIQPLPEACTHYVTEPTRMRKLLLHRREIEKLQRAADQKGYTIVATALYWKKHMVKCEIALAKGKQQHDKRQTEKDRDWNIQKQRAMRHTKSALISGFSKINCASCINTVCGCVLRHCQEAVKKVFETGGTKTVVLSASCK